jgi:hypothetical protein
MSVLWRQLHLGTSVPVYWKFRASGIKPAPSHSARRREPDPSQARARLACLGTRRRPHTEPDVIFAIGVKALLDGKLDRDLAVRDGMGEGRLSTLPGHSPALNGRRRFGGRRHLDPAEATRPHPEAARRPA